MSTRRFELHRDHDVSGVSGTGVVADGVRWPDGSVSIRWRGERPSIVFWHSLADAEQVHGHGGATRFMWLDDGPANDDAEARGYARAVAVLRDDERYDHWWTRMTPDHPEYGYWQIGRRHMADYLETIARDVTTPEADHG
ncbi:hypothetical protein JNW88_00370 [Micromonospora sp. ATA32]|nr:hypothetical protein [Micromonospora sp. ATA32]